jgi:ABC-2 type transport system permease protein
VSTSGVHLKSKAKYFDLIRELAITDFKLKYQGSVAGYLWSLVKPLSVFGVLYLVFTVFVRIGSDIEHYPVYLLIGIVLWSYFAESTTTALHCIVDKGDLIRKVYFPRIVILLSSSISALITLSLNLLVIFLFLLLARISINIYFPLFFLLILELYLLSLGISLFLAALYTKFRDFGHIWEVGLQLLFYASPIIYPLAIVPAKYQKLVLLSPISQIVQDARKVLIGPEVVTSMDVLRLPLSLIPYLIPPILVVIGWAYFMRSASRFAEEV